MDSFFYFQNDLPESAVRIGEALFYVLFDPGHNLGARILCEQPMQLSAVPELERALDD